MRLLHPGLCLLLALLVSPALAEPLRVAVAASFLPALQQLAPAIQEELDIELEWIPGASGTLFAQINQGAPYDLFLSADKARPEALASSGTARPQSLMPYARGKLVLWSPGQAASGELLLQRDARLAIANPALAPYGEAATQVLAAVAPDHDLQVITGNSVGQAFHFAWSGNADMAMVAHAQVQPSVSLPANSVWIIPDHLYTPLDQWAVIPDSSRAADAAWSLLDWLRAPTQQARLADLGYLPLPGDNR